MTRVVANDVAEGGADLAELAVEYRTLAFKIMERSNVAAAHLVLAAATLAPECEQEREVADYFGELVAAFAAQLAAIHRRRRLQHLRQEEQLDGAR
ncbi:hypothetical protein [Sphingomonas sp. BK069]|uniref:hypothetical protein n=1 Tax=Sphingomonas sp. BK069 TaxID=2586979 RepID=UPI0016198431|nr:hypothetical protein [Sphingomonas sp. BK069]MBB3349451.1 hypothetical protein [Sphingomonas sp. BK069]